MQSHDRHVREFLQSVCGEIRFKCIHDKITTELSDHIEDQKNRYIRDGEDEETATIKAVEQMGDPLVIGRQLNKTYSPKIEWSILCLVGLLVAMGGAIQFFLSGVDANRTGMFVNFLMYAPVGVLAFASIYFFDYTLLGRYPRRIYFALTILTAAGFFVLKQVNGSYAHMFYCSLLFIPAFAGIVHGFRGRGYPGIILSGLFYAIPAFLCVMAPSVSGLLLLSVSCLIILTAAVVKGVFGGNRLVGAAMIYVPTALTGIGLFLSMVAFEPYRLKRLISMFQPYNDAAGSGWQQMMIRRVIGLARPIGKAEVTDALSGMHAYEVLPGWTTDTCLTFIIASFGYLAGVAIALIMGLLAVRMLVSVRKQKSAYGFLLSLAACLPIIGQIILFILSNFGVTPPMMMTFPFVSFGAAGFVVNMALAGMVLSVHRRSGIVSDTFQGVRSSARLFTISNGKLIIDLGIRSGD